MNIFYAIAGIFKAIMLKLFPALGYKGVVNTQIDIYNVHKSKGKMSEQEILNYLILTRINASWGEKEEAEKAYGYLLNEDSKTLKDVIKAIINYEYFESFESKAKISEIPPNHMRELEKMKKEYLEYIEKKTANISNPV